MKAIALLLLLATTAIAADMNFAGTWVLSVTKSKNLGMMAAMQLSETIKQDSKSLTVSDASTMSGQTQTTESHYDLTGKAVSNQDFMGQTNDTVSKWNDGHLVTTWTSNGAIAGTKIVRTETRSLSADGKTMTVESTRGSTAPIVMVFDKK
jgi:hypothetical protein